MSAPILSRLDRDAGWLDTAASIARRADCRRCQVGAIVVSADDRYSQPGRNGLPSKQGSCQGGDCPRGLLSYDQVPADAPYSQCRALHAEVNALLYADASRIVGGTMYVTRKPCPDCAKVLAGSGISRVVWPGGEITNGAAS